MFKNVLSFNGRIERKEYLISFASYFVLSMVIQLIVRPYGWSSSVAWIGLAYVPMFYLLMTQTAKRCHDVGRSGWWQIVPLYAFWIFFVAGDPEANKYGQPPSPNQDLDLETIGVQEK